MIIERRESWYIFLYNKGYLNAVYEEGADSGCYVAYLGKRLSNREYLEHWGKWVFFGDREQLDKMALKLDPYVEDGVIPCIKYDPAPQRWAGMEHCVMCVYCDDRQKDEVVWRILTKHGVKEKAWTYEKELLEKWSPGGLHLEKWIAGKGLTDKEADDIRSGAVRKWKIVFDKPDDLFRGWEQ